MAKRIFDIIFSLTAIIILSPFLLPLVILLKVTGEGEVFYKQQRLGKNGNTFYLVKFATMLKESPNLPGGDITVVNDPRVLPFGHFLRKTKINEVPQLWNILKGDMSFVGPRPFTPRTFALYPKYVQEEIISLKPGLTGIGSIVFRDEESIIANSEKNDFDYYCEDVLPYKGQLEIWYKANNSFYTDLKLLFITLWVILIPNSRAYEKLLRDLPTQPTCY